MATLDFSTGKEHRVSVGVRGWTAEQKNAFVRKTQQIAAVTAVQSAGGSTSFYVSYDPEMTSEGDLRAHLTEIAQSVLGIDGRMIDETDGAPQLGPVFVNASTWTGIASIPERILAFKQLAPVAIAAVDCLLNQLEMPGDNGGPPLDERQEAIEALRGLRDALDSLLAAVEKRNFEWADGESLIASCAHFAARSIEKLRNDPLPYVTSGLVLALCSVFGVSDIGGWLAAVTLEMQKTSKDRRY